MIAFLDFKKEIDIGNFIDFASIMVNIFIAWYVTRILQNKLNNSRANKDYLINIISEHRASYDQFFKDLFDEKLNSQKIIHWFKMMTINIESLKENDTENTFDTLLSEHIKLRNIITNSIEFNDQFSEDYFEVSNRLRSLIFPVNKELKRINHNCVRLINN